MALLTDAESAYYFAFEQMFNSGPWGELMKDLQQRYDALPNVWLTATSFDEIVQARLEGVLLYEFLHMPEMIEGQREQLETNRSAELDELQASSGADL